MKIDLLDDKIFLGSKVETLKTLGLLNFKLTFSFSGRKQSWPSKVSAFRKVYIIMIVFDKGNGLVSRCLLHGHKFRIVLHLHRSPICPAIWFIIRGKRNTFMFFQGHYCEVMSPEGLDVCFPTLKLGFESYHG